MLAQPSKKLQVLAASKVLAASTATRKTKVQVNLSKTARHGQRAHRQLPVCSLAAKEAAVAADFIRHLICTHFKQKIALSGFLICQMIIFVNTVGHSET